MSKGMQQRLGLAQSLIGEPRLLLLDEPTSALDPAGRHTVRALLERLRERGVSVLLNSHLLSEVELVCDRVAIIDGGEVVAAGTPAELSRAGGVEVETAAGVRTFADATRDDAPRIVRELVAAGEDVYAVRALTLDARGRLPGGGRPRAGGGRRGRGQRGRRVSATGGAAHAAEPRLRGALLVARFSLRESLRRRVFVVVGLLTVVFLALYGLATWQAFEAADDFTGPTRPASRRTPSSARRSPASRCSRSSSSARSSPSSSRSAPSAATPSAGCCSRCSCGRCRAARCCSAAGSARPPSARRT